jgi:hypothetical protein
MEIRDYLQAIRRWLWLPVILPLVAGAGAGLVLLKQPLQYQADATVVVPAVSARGESTSAAAQYVATFKDVLVSQPLVQLVSNKTHVPVKDLVNGLTASTVTASSNIIHVTFIGYTKNNATAVVDEATRDTLDIVAQPQLVQAQKALASANTQLLNTNSAIGQFTATTGQVLPDQQFRTKQAELSQLLLQLQQTTIAGDAARAAVLQSVIAARQAQLSTLATELPQYTALTQQRQAALTVVAHDEQLLGDAQALLSANHDNKTVTVVDIGKVSRVGNVLRFTAIAAAVALIMALALILLMELMRSRRPAGTVPASGATTADTLLPPPSEADLRRAGAIETAPTNGLHVRRRALGRPREKHDRSGQDVRR